MTTNTKTLSDLQVGDKVEASIRSADGVIDLGVQHNRIVAGA